LTPAGRHHRIGAAGQFLKWLHGKEQFGVISVGVQTWGTDLAALRRYWTAADALGYARITYGDGLGPWTHDGWSMLAALALVTGVARIGPAVTYAFDAAAHHPSWLAKRAVTIDHLSSGRLDLRLGVGAEDEATAEDWTRHAIRYPPAGERLAVLEESIGIMRALWAADGPVHHAGTFYHLRGARLLPGPVQPAGPPIWIAAMGAAALATTARQADGWEASHLSPRDFGERWARLQTLTQAAGRVPAALRRSIELDVLLAASRIERDALVAQFCATRRIDRAHPLLRAALIGEPAAIAGRIAEYARAGATDLMLAFADFPATGMLEAFAAGVVPALVS
jgi:alkanesulfonate monooxygenase SsuD/methylene tetrahydromethanopterin reductase-like flavin-dependent oxidoreductase (luciferase family)